MAELKTSQVKEGVLKTIKGSSLLEVIIAMLISVIIFFFTITIIINLLGGSRLVQKYRHELLIQSTINESFLQPKEKSRQYQLEGIVLSKTVLPYPGDDRLLLITIESLNAGGKSISSTKLIKRKYD